jgi:hypothetical protein
MRRQSDDQGVIHAVRIELGMSSVGGKVHEKSRKTRRRDEIFVKFSVCQEDCGNANSTRYDDLVSLTPDTVGTGITFQCHGCPRIERVSSQRLSPSSRIWFTRLAGTETGRSMMWHKVQL